MNYLPCFFEVVAPLLASTCIVIYLADWNPGLRGYLQVGLISQFHSWNMVKVCNLPAFLQDFLMILRCRHFNITRKSWRNVTSIIIEVNVFKYLTTTCISAGRTLKRHFSRFSWISETFASEILGMFPCYLQWS